MNDLILSLDVGGRVDYAAVMGIESRTAFGGELVLQVVYADRQMGLSTTALADSYIRLVQHFVQRYAVIPVIDARGTGAGVFDALADAGAQPLGVLATAGWSEATRPKPECGGTAMSMTVSNDALIRSLRAALSENHLQLAENLPLRQELEQELLTTTPSLTPAKKSQRFDAPSGEHDDLAASLMLGCWAARWIQGHHRSLRRRIGPKLAHRMPQRSPGSEPSPAGWC